MQFNHNTNGDIMGRLENNYYKTKDFIFKSDKDKRYVDVFNEYGFNFETTKETIYDDTKLATHPSINTTKEYLNMRSKY